MTGPFKKLFFALKNNVFSARNTVGVVNQHNSHIGFTLGKSPLWRTGSDSSQPREAQILFNSWTTSAAICCVVLSRLGSGLDNRPEMASRNF